VATGKLKELIKIPPQLQKQIKKTEDRLREEGKLIGELIKELNAIKREHRATGILVEIYLNLLCSMILSARYKAKSFAYEYNSLTKNRNKLFKIKLISKELHYDIHCIQQIRNIYAHTRLVKQKPASDEIKDWTEKSSTYRHLIPLWKREGKAKNDYEVYLQVVNNIIMKLRRIHGKIWTDRLDDLDQKLIDAKAHRMKLKSKKP